MRRGLRYLPVSSRGRRRLGLLGVGVIAAMSLVWQQQATLASFTDAESAGARFTAATLEPIAPELDTAAASKLKLAWDAPERQWTDPQYVLEWAPSDGGTATQVYSGTERSATHTKGSASQGDVDVLFTDVAAGSSHACGVARGAVYCWGTTTNGLGNGSNSAAAPVKVDGGGLAGKTVSSVTAGNNFTCAIAEGSAYCWGANGSGQLGTGNTAGQATPKAVIGLSGKTVTALSAGDKHTCAVADGTAYCWGAMANGRLGNNQTGTTSYLATPFDVASVSTVLAGRTVSGISAGTAHTCAVADGVAFCWGLNDNGRLGDASSTQRPTAVAVNTDGVLMGRSVQAVSAGAQHTCAIADRQAFCWGLGTNGRLGNGATSSANVPVRVGGSHTGYTAISAGLSNSCGIAGGKAYCWGLSTALGNGAGSDSSSPVAVTGTVASRSLTAISVGGAAFACATGNTPAACWGSGTGNRLGDGSTADNPVPADVVLVDKACPENSVRIAGSGCSLTEDTTYYYRLKYSIGSWNAAASSWMHATTKKRSGVNPSSTGNSARAITLAWDVADEPGQAYAEYTLERSPDEDGDNRTTVAVTGDTRWTDTGGLAPTREFEQVASGGGHSCGILGGDLYCWGQNQNGQLGIGTTDQKTVPTKVPGLPSGKVTDVSAGTSHTCAVANGAAYCWGLNTSYRLGDGTTTQRLSPVAVTGAMGSRTVTGISAGASHTCAIAAGQAYCWGLNSDGQVGNNSTNVAQTPVAVNAGEMPSLNVRDIAAGGAHTCAINTDSNRAYCWGQNVSWQLGSRNCQFMFGQTCFNLTESADKDRTTPVAVETSGEMGTQAVTAITAGALHTCAIAANKAYCWGEATNGQLGDGSTTDTRQSQAVATTTMTGAVTRISAGDNHTCAIAAAKAYCWGVDASGQLGNGTGGASGTPVAVTANGALDDAAVTGLSAGANHTCSVAGGDVYCWGANATGQLGDRTTTGSPVAVKVVPDARCASGAVALGNGTCTLAPGTTYYYRVSYTLDGNTKTTGSWRPATTG